MQQAAFDLGQEVAAFSLAQGGIGAVVTFSGVVRDTPQAPLEAMEIEHYPGMTETALAEIAQRALTRFGLGDVWIIHRYGQLRLGETIMMVATSARHRKSAFEGAEYLMDYLKSRAPFWKREITAEGAQWVAATEADEDALTRW